MEMSVDNHVGATGRILTEIDDTLERLLSELGASRVTLRRDLPGGYAFPVTNTALAEGVPSLREERTVDLRTQPVVRELQRGHQVVQADCRSAFDDPAFHSMLETYGGLAAQIVTPVRDDGGIVAILSVHQLGAPRAWTPDEVDACTRTAQRLAELL